MCGNTTTTSNLHNKGDFVPEGFLPFDPSKVGPGVDIVNRVGFPVRILGTLAGDAGRALVTAQMNKDGNENVRVLYTDGLYWNDGDRDNDDIFLRPTKKHIHKWANVYADESIEMFDTQEEAAANVRTDKHCVNPATQVRFGYFDLPAA